MQDRLATIREEIKKMHDESQEEYMRQWFYEGHVAIVAEFAAEIAPKVGARSEIAVLAALFHDIARTWGVDKEPDLMNESLAKAQEILSAHDYSEEDIEAVKQAILLHSCRNQIPDTEEGKVVATADALAHFFSDFYFILPFYGWLKAATTFEGYRTWLLEKIERDYTKKILYPEYIDKAKPKYEALKTLFKST